MLRTSLISATVLVSVLPAPAEAAGAHDLSIPAGPLSDALIALGKQTGTSIGTPDPAIARVRSRGLRGRFTVDNALRRLLRDSGFTFRFVDSQTVLIVRASDTRRTPAKAARRPTPTATRPTISTEAPPIIVTGSKRGIAFEDYPASVAIFDLEQDGTTRTTRGTDAIVQRLPVLASTSLGPGRNKLFIRGVADSSFNGPSQATVGQYLGDVRLAYNAPDPDLNLYDIKQIEVLEGPQGTLYGAGSLGGILRLVPNDPDAAGFGARLMGGWTGTRHGADGSDLAGMLNLPIVADRVAVRAVGYRTLDPGYIDDAERGLKDVNRATTWGGRASAQVKPGNGWTIDLGWLVQNIDSRDGQYAERDLPPLTRRSAIAQPFDNDYSLAQFVVRKRWDGMELVSASGWVKHDLGTVFDATGFDGTSGPAAFLEDTKISLLSHESRLSGRFFGGGRWVAGLSLIQDVSRINRSLGDPDGPDPITGVRNEVFDAALFGEVSFVLFDGVSATLGGRATYSHLSGELLDDPAAEEMEPTRSENRFLPTVALSWKPLQKMLLFARYQEGFRAGGLAIDASTSPATSSRFEADTIATVEAGLRYGEARRDPLAFALTLSYARWSDIQADLIDARGLPFTTNIGSGRIYGLEAHANWRPTDRLSLEASLFRNNSALNHPDPAFADAEDRELPNIPRTGARAAALYAIPIAPDASLTVDASLRYVGESQLGIGPPIDIEQGKYFEANLGSRLDIGRYGFSLDVTNIGDVRANRFSFGNPFHVADRMQITPLRPRSIRIGFDVAF